MKVGFCVKLINKRIQSETSHAVVAGFCITLSRQHSFFLLAAEYMPQQVTWSIAVHHFAPNPLSFAVCMHSFSIIKCLIN